MTSTLREWRVRQKWGVIGRRGAEGREWSGRPIFISFIKENWICAMTRHHANNILLARNLPFDSDVTFFLFDFVYSQCNGSCSIVCSHFQVRQIKQVDCKMSSKKTFFKKIFCDISGRLPTQEHKVTKK